MLRIVYYATAQLLSPSTVTGVGFSAADWPVYVAVAISSLVGVVLGQKVFKKIKNKQSTYNTLFAVLLVVCSVSLMVTGVPQVA